MFLRSRPKKAAILINKTLKSAIANAENNANLKPDGLVVKEAVVGEGPTIKRMMARARGSGSQILKRTSHIRIVLTDEIEIETRETRKEEARTGKEGRSRRKESATRAKEAQAKEDARNRSQRNSLWDKKLIQLDFAWA